MTLVVLANFQSQDFLTLKERFGAGYAGTFSKVESPGTNIRCEGVDCFTAVNDDMQFSRNYIPRTWSGYRRKSSIWKEDRDVLRSLRRTN